jgi:hypothetical protein
MADEDWKWWVGPSEERFEIQCSSRDEAVELANCEYGDGAWIIEAKHPSTLMLSSYFEADYFLEQADERAYDDHGDHDSSEPVFEVTNEQSDDLQRRVREAIDQWQDAHGLKFRAHAFSAQRNCEFIPAPTNEQ